MGTGTRSSRRQNDTEEIEYSFALSDLRDRLLLLLGSNLLISGIMANLEVHPDALSAALGVEISPIAIVLVGMTLLGLLSGVLLHLLFPKSHIFVQFSLGFLLVILAWYFSELTENFIRDNVLGIPLIQESNWVDLAEIGLGTAAAWIPIQLWQPSRKRATRETVRQIEVSEETEGLVGNLKERATNWLGAMFSRPIKIRTSNPPGNNRIKIVVPRKKSQPARLRWRLLPRRSNVHLGKEATSVCPYCLEEVAEDAPKVLCDVCGTAHHADCWAITGKCQVPHLQG